MSLSQTFISSSINCNSRRLIIPSLLSLPSLSVFSLHIRRLVCRPSIAQWWKVSSVSTKGPFIAYTQIRFVTKYITFVTKQIRFVTKQICERKNNICDKRDKICEQRNKINDKRNYCNCNCLADIWSVTFVNWPFKRDMLTDVDTDLKRDKTNLLKLWFAQMLNI